MVISTAIRAFSSPTYWASLDGCGSPHGAEGIQACRDASVIKLVPHYKRMPGVNVHPVPYNRRRSHDAGRSPFDRQLPLLRDEHYSLLFGLQYVSWVGFSSAIVAGCDLVVSGAPYAYAYSGGATGLKAVRTMVERLFQSLRRWTPLAREAGFELINWSPGGKLSELGWSPYDENCHAKVSEAGPA